jgi:hypothetical protein
MPTLKELLDQTTAMHRHLCPRQVLGVRMGLYAGELLGLALPQSDKRLYTIVETDGCAADGIAVDYLRLASAVPGVLALDGGATPDALRAALEAAFAHDGLSLVHVPVYYGPDPLGGLGAYGAWNVGNWCEDVQARYHAQNI